MNILSSDYQKLVVFDLETGKEIAVITEEEVITADENIVVKLTPTYEEDKKEMLKTVERRPV